ncbi:MAG: LamG domain-containing protein [Dehalococcoidia bacterium]
MRLARPRLHPTTGLLLAAVAAALALSCGSDDVTLEAQRRTADGTVVVNTLTVPPEEIGIVIIDVWNAHWDPVAQARVDALVPVLNLALDDARAHGMTVFMAFADVPVERIRAGEPSAAESGSDVAGLTITQGFPGNGFWWPEAPHTPYFGADPQQNQVPPGIDRAAPFGVLAWDDAHPNLRIDDEDVVIDFELWTDDLSEAGWLHPSTQHLIREAKDRGITHLIFVGVHTNWSVLHKNLGMTNMKRAGFTVLLARDLGDAFTGNGRDWERGIDDPSLTPDSGNRLVNDFLERWFDGTVTSWQWARTDETRYAATIGRTPGVIAHWRFEGAGERMPAYLDDLRLEAAWQDPASARVCPGVSGTAVCFDGQGALVLAPHFRETLPPDSPLASLSAVDASLEVWVRADGDGTIVAHRDAARLDFELGVTEGRLQLTARDGAVIVRSPEGLAAGEWHHVVAVFAASTGQVRLYVDGDLAAEDVLAGEASSVPGAWAVGAAGPVQIADGDPGESADGRIISTGSGAFTGAVDELAVYLTALDEATIRQHAEQGGAR